MPIRAQHRWLYPIDWSQLSAVIRFERADGRCEHCARPHGQLVCHLGDGRWWDQERGAWRDGQGRLVRSVLPSPDAGTRTTRVFLATAHLDHDPGNSQSPSHCGDGSGIVTLGPDRRCRGIDDLREGEVPNGLRLEPQQRGESSREG